MGKKWQTFKVEAVASVTADALFGDLAEVQEVIEWALGHSVWVWEIEKYAPRAKRAILAQYPNLPTKYDRNLQAVADVVDYLQEEYGGRLLLERGNAVRDERPLHSFRSFIANYATKFALPG